MDDVLHKAIDTFGIGNQIQMVIEELSELLVEVSRVNRGRGVTDKIIEEVADVEIMLAQLKIIYNINLKVSDKKNEKIMRLKERLCL